MLWVSLAVSVLVGLAVREFFIGYVRRNGHDGYWPLKGAWMPAITIGPGLGVLLVNPRNGALLLALSIPVVAVTLFWYRQLR